ncbi:MAG: PSD1 and planctomycete cytochrome C domain-containing protein [Pirellulales bacterium]
MNKLGLSLVILFSARMGVGDEVKFARQIQPILAKNCFSCHGHDAKHRKAKLRLDTRSGATADRDETPAVVAGKSNQSGLIARVTSGDPDERMPPADSGRELTEKEIGLLRRWIDQGAKYEQHWAFQNPRRGPLPKVGDGSWPKNAIDHYVLARLEAEGLQPSADADRHTLVRRLSFDLTGLPPTQEQVGRFIEDRSPGAYEGLVDRLLDSPHYGERWARVWMDLARYADTQGYEKDRPRAVWTWRDWVIKALNDDMPYDQFTTEQLAGDLLPQTTSQQKLATVFHRNTMTNTEGGTDDEEFRVAAVKDRVDTTGLIWLGLSVGCAKCHSHKYDPISQTEYYQLFDFFNQTADADRYDDAPKLALPSEFYYQQHRELSKQLATAKKQLRESTDGGDAARKKVAELQELLEQKAVAMKPPAVPVLQELPEQNRRATRLLIKGDFLNQGDEVRAGVPQSLHSISVGAPMNRLGLARWLMDRENPLTARVTVNRMWSRLFGGGLVETEEDFGTQGEPPSHPGLLDWLAIEFRDSHGWSQKKLLKTIVMSATYRQSSRVNRQLLNRDPRNRLLGRGARFRLDAEMIRDQALAVSGLLSRNLYGPPVMPPQPDGVWKTVYNTDHWVTSQGRDRYRRGLYTFSKRTTPYPSFLLFDAGSGEICLPRRIRTNTVTAALVTLNDPVFTEAAQAVARRVVEEAGVGAKQRAAFAWQLITARRPAEGEASRILQLFEEQLVHYRQHKDAAHKMATNPLGPLPDGADVAEMAAWTVVASVLLNLDETLSRG